MFNFVLRLFNFVCVQTTIHCTNSYCDFIFQDEVTDLKAAKDVPHSTLEELDTEDLYVKLKVNVNFKTIRIIQGKC